MAKLSADVVQRLMIEVLFRDDELESRGGTPADAILVDGIINRYAFHPERIRTSKPEIDAMLSELPDTFFKSKGGGWSFLNACQDRHGNLWTGLHQRMEELICLGIAAGSASWIMKEFTELMPGGVPYFEVHPSETSEAI